MTWNVALREIDALHIFFLQTEREMTDTLLHTCGMGWLVSRRKGLSDPVAYPSKLYGNTMRMSGNVRQPSALEHKRAKRDRERRCG